MTLPGEPGHVDDVTLIDFIERGAVCGAAVRFINGDEVATTDWAQLHGRARSVAAELQARGVSAGDHVGLIGPTTQDLVVTIQAVLLCGATLVMLPLPMRMGSLEAFIEQTRGRIRTGDVAQVVIDSQLTPLWIPHESDPDFIDLEDLVVSATAAGSDGYVRPVVSLDALAVLQFTSGSTSEPKGVMLTHRQICANIRASVEAGGVTEADVLVSWLPLYHDMGLIGFLLIPMCEGVRLVLAAPQDFLSRPVRWMQWISDYGGTTTAGPNFAYSLVTRSLRKAEGLDLSAMRLALNGAEPVDAEGFREFLLAGERHGLDPHCAFAAFGMAEVCIGGAFPTPGSGLQTHWVDVAKLEADHEIVDVAPGAEGSKEMVMLGRPVPGLRMEIRDPQTMQPLRERCVGELWITGTSVTRGYYRNAARTSEMLVDGWLRTGDLAYLVDGQLVICGRIKDVIIIGGRNVYPQDIEWAVGTLDDVRTGNVIAFGEPGPSSSQHIVVVAESKTEEIDALRQQIARLVAAEVGVPPRTTVIVAPGTIPKTSSGKLQRSLCRDQFHRGEFDVR